MTVPEKLWGGRFTGSADADFAEYNDSFRFDRRLFVADIRASAAHCNALFHAGVLTRLEAEKIKSGLGTLLKRAEFSKDYLDDPSEDVHSFIESKLVQLSAIPDVNFIPDGAVTIRSQPRSGCGCAIR